MNSQWSKLLQEFPPSIHVATSIGLVQAVDFLVGQGADPFQIFVYDIEGLIFEHDVFTLAAGDGQLDVLYTVLNKGLPLERDSVKKILRSLDYRKAGKIKLASILQTMWDHGLLRKQSDGVDEIDEDLFMSTITNQISGEHMMEVFLDWEPRVSLPMTENVVFSATCWNIGVVQTLFEKPNFRFSQNLVERLTHIILMEDPLRTEGFSLFATKRPNEIPIDKYLFETFMENLDFETFKSLMQARASDVAVTETVLEKAATNQKSGRIFRLLWPHRESGVVISELMLRHALMNQHAEDLVSFMQENIEFDMNLSEDDVDILLSTSMAGVTCLKLLQSLSTHGFSVSTRITETICRHKDAIDMLSLLVSQEGFNIPITEGIVGSAASNRFQGPAILKYLAKVHQKSLPVTESILVSAVQNQEYGEDILEMLLQDSSSTLLTDQVFEEACGNPDTLSVLLGQRQSDLPIAAMLDIIVEGTFWWRNRSRKALQILLEQNLLKIDESVVETLAADFYTLDLLLSLEPRAPITEKALIAGTNDDRSMRVLLGARRSASPVSENVLKAAVHSLRGQEVMTVIQYRQGSLDITENVIKEAIYSGLRILVAWLLEQCSDTLARAFFRDNWRDPELYEMRLAIMEGFFKKTGSRVTESLLQDWPFDPETGATYSLGSLIFQKDEIFELPATELAAEFIVERCYIGHIEHFWKDKQIPVTDGIICFKWQRETQMRIRKS